VQLGGFQIGFQKAHEIVLSNIELYSGFDDSFDDGHHIYLSELEMNLNMMIVLARLDAVQEVVLCFAAVSLS
jgi:hypothetical protein